VPSGGRLRSRGGLARHAPLSRPLDGRPHGQRLAAEELGSPGAERLVWSAGSLWATGRGLDLLRIDPRTGATVATVEIGAAGIELAVTPGRVWVTAATQAGARRGDPRAAALLGVDTGTGEIAASRWATGPLMVDGLTAGGGAVWLADTVHGVLVRSPG
jgi:hypothetical protein